MLEAVLHLHAEERGDRGERQEQGGKQVEAMAGARERLAATRRLFAALGGGVGEPVLGVADQQLAGRCSGVPSRSTT